MHDTGTTHIHTLRLRGSRSAQERVSRALQLAQWPEVGEDEYVLVRRVQALAQPHKMAAAVLQQTRQCVQQDTNPDNVVRFPNLTALLASLLLDLARGQAAGRWYWRRWSHLFTSTPGAAIGSLLADHLPHLSAVVERLAQQQQLAQVWNALTEADSAQLLRELNGQQGYRIAPLSAAALQEPSVSPTQALPTQLRQRWQPLLAPLPPADLRRQLALALIAREWIPLSLWQAPQQALQQVAAALGTDRHPPQASGAGMTPAADQPALNSPQTVLNQPSGTRANPMLQDTDSTGSAATPTPAPQIHAREMHSPDVHSAASIAADWDAQPAALSSARSGANPAQQPPAALPNHTDANRSRQSPIHTDPSQSANAHAQEVPSDPSSATADITTPAPDPQFHTHQGGVLYLLNFLNRAELQSLMGDYWAELPNGWLWLLRVAQLLGLDANDPMTEFLTGQLGLTNPNQLDQLPPLPQPERIRQLALLWYGRQDLWQPALLALPATVRHNASHIDLYTDPARIRIEVRLAGLDINPGWLPWLGRVVNFHYQTPPDPTRAR